MSNIHIKILAGLYDPYYEVETRDNLYYRVHSGLSYIDFLETIQDCHRRGFLLYDKNYVRLINPGRELLETYMKMLEL